MRRAIGNARARLSSKIAYRAIPFALLLLALAVLFYFSVEVGEGDTLAWDQAFLLALRHADDVALPLGPAWITTTMVNFTSLGGVAVLLFITLATIGLLLVSRRPVEALFLCVALAGGWLSSNTLKLWAARPRPDVVTHLAAVGDASFPSGHAMVSAATYLALAIVASRFLSAPAQKAYIFMVAGTLICTIGVSRIYLGVHYPTDVLFGWCAGSLWTFACWLTFRRFFRHRSDGDAFR
ncbi:phosphatase PAP2 family protein [Rhizobium sp. 42MFCr.1]|uniref:phosphatase PAP2 family protein n=1 Tax=Rhizobium sp. 42MFCr.1 TaxID=1048680 RepID=UPI000367DA31|nr:phosphatase PAP2 family protein [Rhizobium sp. 42MFCr.1]